MATGYDLVIKTPEDNRKGVLRIITNENGEIVHLETDGEITVSSLTLSVAPPPVPPMKPGPLEQSIPPDEFQKLFNIDNRRGVTLT